MWKPRVRTPGVAWIGQAGSQAADSHLLSPQQQQQRQAWLGAQLGTLKKKKRSSPFRSSSSSWEQCSTIVSAAACVSVLDNVAQPARGLPPTPCCLLVAAEAAATTTATSVIRCKVKGRKRTPASGRRLSFYQLSSVPRQSCVRRGEEKKGSCCCLNVSPLFSRAW